jgi:predicted MFS family arabinose efflux permease
MIGRGMPGYVGGQGKARRQLMTDQISEWRRGWKTVLAGMVGMATGTSAVAATGVVMHPLAQEFGWGRGVVASNVLFCSVAVLLLGAPAGLLVARYGARRVALISQILAIPAVMLVAASGGATWTWYAVWAIYSVINIGISPVVWTPAVAGLFNKSRGLAMAVTLSGSGLAFFVVAPLMVVVERAYGWRAVYFALALVLLAVLPLIFAFFHTREDLSGLARGSSGDDRPPESGHSLAEAFRTRQFWQLAAVMLLVASVEGALVMHLFPILSEAGLERAVAAGITSSMGLAMIVGRIGTGFLLDRLPGSQVYTGSIVLILVACLLARMVEGSAMAGAAVAILLGLGAGGTVNATAYVTARFFGLAAFASIFGVMMGIFGVAYGAGPSLIGFLRDGVDSYAELFLGMAVAAGVSALFAATLGRAPRQIGNEATAPA